MAMDDIKNELEKKFDEPLKEFYKRKIIFWNDESGEFQEDVKDLELSNAKVLILSETNQFASKKLLSCDDEKSNYLVYNPLIKDLEHDWLLDIKLYSEEYRADKVSRLMQELNILNTVELKREVEQYIEFFKSSKRREALHAVSSTIDKRSTLILSILAVICKIKDIKPEAIIQAVITGGPDLDNEIKMDLLKYGISDKFFAMVHNSTGFNNSDSIDDLTEHVILSALVRTLSTSILSGLESRYSEENSGFCYYLVFNWIHSAKKDEFKNVAEYVTSNLSLVDRFNRYEIKDLIESDILPIIDEIILSKLMYAISVHSMDAETIISIVEKRKTSAWYDEYGHFYEGIYQVALMKQFEAKYTNSFHFTNAKEMWDAYTRDLYLMDQYYREFHLSYSKCLQSLHPLLDDTFKDLVDYVEKEYKNWYLDKLSSNWNKVIEEDLSTTGKITDISQQVDFYRDYVEQSKGKVFVIISDAMRYDVACELAKQLEIETNADITVNAVQSTLPSITKFGMAALLPHKKIETVLINNQIKVLVDGHSSEMSDRDSILKAYNENSLSVKAKDLVTMKQAERRSIVKGKEVVYVYHDTIDSFSHNDENTVFDSCDRAIGELKTVVNVITGDLSCYNILITSDHGFLYTYKALKDEDMMERKDFKKDIIEQERRFVITNNEANPDFLMSVKGIYNEQDMLGFAPRENIRIKGAGGSKFVHGGISLQEMCVPVIQYKFLRAGNKTYELNRDKYDTKPVSIALLSSNRKISNMIFNLNFYQKEAVKDNYIACTYYAYMEDSDGNVVSDKQKIIANKTSLVTKDREFKCTFNLKSQKFMNNKSYYLVIVNEDGTSIPIKEEFQIDIAMAIDDFDFFK